MNMIELKLVFQCMEVIDFFFYECDISAEKPDILGNEPLIIWSYNRNETSPLNVSVCISRPIVNIQYQSICVEELESNFPKEYIYSKS